MYSAKKEVFLWIVGALVVGAFAIINAIFVADALGTRDDSVERQGGLGPGQAIDQKR